MPQTVRFRNWTCKIREGRYGNGNVALKLVDAEDGSPIATATVNIDGVNLADDEVCIKDYSENEGMAAALEVAGLVKPTGRWAESGFVRGPVCKLVGELGR